MQQQFTPEQSIAFVDEACAKFQGSRADHRNLEQAIMVLRDLVQAQQAKTIESQVKQNQVS